MKGGEGDGGTKDGGGRKLQRRRRWEKGRKEKENSKCTYLILFNFNLKNSDKLTMHKIIFFFFFNMRPGTSCGSITSYYNIVPWAKKIKLLLNTNNK